MSCILRILCLLSLLTLSACSYFHTASTKKAYCNMLKSDLVFNGSTPNTREANIQKTEQPLLQSNYDEAQCDEHNGLS